VERGTRYIPDRPGDEYTQGVEKICVRDLTYFDVAAMDVIHTCNSLDNTVMLRFKSRESGSVSSGLSQLVETNSRINILVSVKRLVAVSVLENSFVVVSNPEIVGMPYVCVILTITLPRTVYIYLP
jgi:hypothetical protein